MAAFNPNVRNGKKPQDNPFLTLSQRVKEGISSENIKGTNAAFGPKKADNINVFGQEEAQGLKTDAPWFAQEEKGGEEYIKEDEQGNVSFDDKEFYDDAWGISLGNTTDPIKAGSSQKDSAEIKSELTQMVKNDAADNEIEDKKEELKAQGVSNAEIDTIVENNSSAKKSGSTLNWGSSSAGYSQTANGTVSGVTTNSGLGGSDPINGNSNAAFMHYMNEYMPISASSGVVKNAKKEKTTEQANTGINWTQIGANALAQGTTAVGGKVIGGVWDNTAGKQVNKGLEKLGEGYDSLCNGAKKLVGMDDDKEDAPVKSSKSSKAPKSDNSNTQDIKEAENKLAKLEKDDKADNDAVSKEQKEIDSLTKAKENDQSAEDKALQLYSENLQARDDAKRASRELETKSKNLGAEIKQLGQTKTAKQNELDNLGNDANSNERKSTLQREIEEIERQIRTKTEEQQKADNEKAAQDKIAGEKEKEANKYKEENSEAKAELAEKIKKIESSNGIINNHKNAISQRKPEIAETKSLISKLKSEGSKRPKK